MALNRSQKVDVRRHLGYSIMGVEQVSAGAGSAGNAFGSIRFMEAWGVLENRLNRLAPEEECRLVGTACASVTLVGPGPNPGDTLQITLSGGNLGAPVIITWTALLGQQNIDVIKSIASLAAKTAALANGGVICFDTYGLGPFAENTVPLPEVSFVSPVAFNIAVVSTGNMAGTVGSTGALQEPVITVDSLSPPTKVRGFLNICNFLEDAVGGATQNQDTIRADVWFRSFTEFEDRDQLLSWYRNAMAKFLGCMFNPELPGGTGGGSPMQVI